ncbi:Nn.00g020940.m01.CDS01 [Neocucurbitaria sp. VM-36]
MEPSPSPEAHHASVAQTKLWQVDTYINQGQQDTAEITLLELLHTAKETEDFLVSHVNYRLAKLALDRKDYLRAEETCAVAVNGFLTAVGVLSEAYSDAIILLTVIYLALEDKEKASQCKALLSQSPQTLPERFILCSKEIDALRLYGFKERAGRIGCDFLKDNYSAKLPWKPELYRESGGFNWTEMQRNIETGGLVGESTGFSPIHYLSMADPEAHLEIDYIVKSGPSVNAVWTMPGVQKNRFWHGCTPLMNAAASGRLEICRVLLSYGANVIAASYRKRTALFLAASGGHIQVIEELLQHGLEIDWKDSEGDTPLSIACYKGHFETVDYLIKRGAKFDTTDVKSYSTMHLAVEGNNRKVLELLRSKGVSLESENDLQERPIHRAAMVDALDALEFLLDNDVELEPREEKGETPLHYAAFDGGTACLKLLLTRGANVNVHAANGDSPLHQAALKGQVGSMEVLLSAGADIHARGLCGDAPIHRAALIDNPGAALLLIHNGADIEARADDGSTPLHIASECEHVDVVSTLISHGADISVMDAGGEGCLTRAAAKGKLESVTFLLDKGAPLTSKVQPSENSTSVLDQAIGAGSLAIVQLLIAKLRDQCQSWLLQHPRNMSPVHRATVLGHHEILDELIQIAPDSWSIDAPLSDGTTALHHAAYFGQTRCVQSLCERGASVLCQNVALDTPLHFACHRGNTPALKVMLDAMTSKEGSDSSKGINTMNVEGLTPLLEAVQAGHDECVPILLEAGASITGKSEPKRRYFDEGKRNCVDVLRVYHEKLASMPEPDVALVKDLVHRSEPWTDLLMSRRQQIMNPQAKVKRFHGGDPPWIVCNLKSGNTSNDAAQEPVDSQQHQLTEVMSNL